MAYLRVKHLSIIPYMVGIYIYYAIVIILPKIFSASISNSAGSNEIWDQVIR